jgi:arylsulfatase A
MDETTKRPNVIMILADDLGYSELGCYGNTFNETPNLDRLATQGVKLSCAYSAAPVCSPYRASLMTGQYPARIGITDYLRPDDVHPLDPRHITLAKMLRRNGYMTGLVGKWHLSGYHHCGVKEISPCEHGFQETVLSENRGIADGSYKFPYHWNQEIRKHLPGEEEFLLDRQHVEALDFIDRHHDRPFFLLLSHYAVHTRMLGHQKLVDKYEAKPEGGKGQDAPRNNPHLAAQLEVIDDGVGQIMEKLDQLGLAENTILLFTSDNGGESRVTTNAPLRGGKSELYEGGLREPFVMRCPGSIPAGTTCDVPISTPDLYPTFLDMLGIEPDPAQPLDGVSLSSLLTGQSDSLPRDRLFWYYPLPENHFLGGRSSNAIRKGDYKLIEQFDDQTDELYNLADDLGETHNLAAECPDRVAELKADLAQWRREMNVPVPPPHGT